MDIQQLMALAAPAAKASPRSGADAPSGDATFAAQLAALTPTAQPAAADVGAPGTNVARSAWRDGAAALDTTALGALRQALGSGDRQALEAWLGEMDMPQNDTEALLAALNALLQPGHQEAAARLPAALESAARHGSVDATARGQASVADGSADAWFALRERLALIDQAGRLHAAELSVGDSAELAALASAPVMATLTQGEGSRPLEALKGAPQMGPRAPLQQAVVEAMQRAEQAQTQADGAAPTRTATATAPTRQAEPPPAVLPPATGEGGRATLMEGGALPSATPQPNVQPAAVTGHPAIQVATASIGAPVGSPAWPQQLGQQLVRMSQSGGEQRLELRLHPAELGPLAVSLTLGEQGAQAHFLSAHAQVRQLLEQALPQLREALAEQGIELGEATVGEQRSGGDGREADKGDAPRLAAGAEREGDEAELDAPFGTAAQRELRLDGRVDLYA